MDSPKKPSFVKFLTAGLFAGTTAVLLSIGVVPDAPAGDQGKSPGGAKATIAREPRDDFDRLDGKGPSRKRVDVIEWENNLEVHVYPKGSLKSLGLKVDRTNKNRPVMVIEYAFNGVPYSLIRRAILGIKLTDQFLTFKAPSDDDYDKIMISNNSLEGVMPYPVHVPRQMYPDYYGEDEAAPAPPPLAETGSPAEPNRAPAQAVPSGAERPKTYEIPSAGGPARSGVKMKEPEKPRPNVDEDGNIRSFEF